MKCPPATHYGHVDTPIGRWLVLADGPAVTGVLLAGVEGSLDPPEGAEPGGPVVARACTELEEYFAGTRRTFDVEVACHGTEFQRAVWQELRRVPYGETTTYTQLATRIGRPNAVRAVGAANGAIPVSVLVPCHRVVGADRTLRGYASGVERKRWLLEHERGGTPG